MMPSFPSFPCKLALISMISSTWNITHCELVYRCKFTDFCLLEVRFVAEGIYVPKLVELGVLCMPASFITYQMPQGLMQDCLLHWAESQYWCQKWDVNHSWLGPVLNLGLLSLDVSNFPGLSGRGGAMDREEVSSYMFVFSCQSWGVQPSLGTSCWAAV